jgi:hypothetical protein
MHPMSSLQEVYQFSSELSRSLENPRETAPGKGLLNLGTARTQTIQPFSSVYLHQDQAWVRLFGAGIGGRGDVRLRD